ncbi:TPA_asm: hypothetical protein [Capsaspora MELD virus 1]|nr:TPA_asm: hypothetical protein [Capsaspora MELD virus 1]
MSSSSSSSSSSSRTTQPSTLHEQEQALKIELIKVRLQLAKLESKTRSGRQLSKSEIKTNRQLQARFEYLDCFIDQLRFQQGTAQEEEAASVRVALAEAAAVRQVEEALDRISLSDEAMAAKLESAASIFERLKKLASLKMVQGASLLAEQPMPFLHMLKELCDQAEDKKTEKRRAVDEPKKKIKKKSRVEGGETFAAFLSSCKYHTAALSSGTFALLVDSPDNARDEDSIVADIDLSLATTDNLTRLNMHNHYVLGRRVNKLFNLWRKTGKNIITTYAAHQLSQRLSYRHACRYVSLYKFLSQYPRFKYVSKAWTTLVDFIPDIKSHFEDVPEDRAYFSTLGIDAPLQCQYSLSTAAGVVTSGAVTDDILSVTEAEQGEFERTIIVPTDDDAPLPADDDGDDEEADAMEMGF